MLQHVPGVLPCLGKDLLGTGLGGSCGIADQLFGFRLCVLHQSGVFLLQFACVSGGILCILVGLGDLLLSCLQNGMHPSEQEMLDHQKQDQGIQQCKKQTANINGKKI